ncbi:hypothetical protein Adt_37489 [Abeliophyllum distichum]|uniref:Uncharacterized protein n=1 Tax=Abeliophyllum distichum TaxID=126358 RepID=A0ABD1QMN0_9LAMI
MVVALGPGKFYGSSLPRPQFYTDVKLNDERVDPPAPFMDPLMSWAQEAHWSMGGLSFQRHRLQGRIEGNVKKLHAQHKESQKQNLVKNCAVSPSSPQAPVANKRRRVVGLVDEEEEENESEREIRRGAVRRLGDDFERVARESGMGRKIASPAKNVGCGGSSEELVSRTRSKRKQIEEVVDKGKGKKGKRKSVKGGKNVGAAVASVAGIRSSPRLVKHGGST